MQNDLVLDTWAGLDFKKRAVPTGSDTIVDWCGDQRRRLNAYTVLASYQENVSRFFLDVGADEEDVRDERRELGDAQVIIDTLLSSILGNDVTITCEDEELLKWAQKRGRQWRIIRKLFQWEEKAIGLGDGVIAMWIDKPKGRVKVRVFDPATYYPVLDGSSNEEFPKRVHIAWEFDRVDEENHEVRYLRRMTWDLREVEGGGERCFYSDGEWLVQDLGIHEDYDNLLETRARWYTNADGEELHDIDLKVDYIPVVHLPNTQRDDDEHFGKSSLVTVAQILDEIQATDSDLAKGASIAGFPPLAAEGALSEVDDRTGKVVETYGPGTVFGGNLSTIDTSKSLDALLKYLDKLLARLAVNSHLPESVIGRVRPSEVPSGLAFALGFAPLMAMVYRMRLVREEKYPLVFKFAYGLEKAAGISGLPEEPDEDTDWPTFKPGSFLPSDLEYVIKNVTNLLAARPRAISLETAVMMLIEAGLPIEDAKEEVDRIRKTDFEAAETLVAATGDEREAYKYLGMQVPDDFEPPSQPHLGDDPITDDQHRGPRPGPSPDPVAPPLT